MAFERDARLRFANVVNDSFSMLVCHVPQTAAHENHRRGQVMANRAIDLVHLARQTGGDDVLEQELLALFAEQCQRQITIIREAADRMKCADAAHTLKGAALAVGAWNVAEAADAVEISLAKATPAPDLPTCVVALSAAALEACGMIAALSVAA